jgi:type II secretory pathway pseudopilin PulG
VNLKESSPAILTLIGALLAAAGVFWSAQRQREKQSEIVSLNRELATKSDEISKLARQLSNSVTGGDSYCYLFFSPIDSNNTAIVQAVNGGSDPIYEAAADICDVDAFNDRMKNVKPGEPLSIKAALDGRVYLEIGNIGVSNSTLGDHVGKTLPVRFAMGPGNSHRYNIFIFQRNGRFVELLRLQKVAAGWPKLIES